MANTITLKTKDLCEALSIERHQLRAWTDTLPPYCEQKTKARSARKYQPVDLLFFSVIKHMSEMFCLTPTAIAKFSDELYTCIKEPQILTGETLLFISPENGKCERLDKNRVSREGFIVNIQPAYSLMCEFLGLLPQQSALQLGLVKVK
ncbi:MAG: MerR family transcriptional regulator [Gammaproteobacteria bacterium]|jgi:hypothetical protein